MTTPARDGTARRPRGRPSRGGHAASDQQHGTSDQPKTHQNQLPASHADRVTSQKNTNRDFSRFIYTDPSSTPTSNTATTPGSDAVQKRRGRPPGVKNKTPQSDKGIPKRDILHHALSGTNIPMPAKPYINGSVTTPVKPSGLRHALTPTNSVAVVIPSRSPSIVNTPQTGSAKGGGPQKIPVHPGRRTSQPLYKIYRCLWEQCPAELHSLETLKKHVRKHRENEAGFFLCLWANCYDGNTSITDGSQAKNRRQRLNFGSDTEWQEHMEKKHLDTVARELNGDPTTYLSGECSQNLVSS